MDLKYIYIENFRSIKECKITFPYNFQSLVGINESGKSNVLKAISMLNSDVEFNKNDIRDPSHNEDPVEDSYIQFVFNVRSALADGLCDAVAGLVLSNNTKSLIMDYGDKQYTVDEFCRNFKNQYLYKVDLKKETRRVMHWTMFGPRYRIHANWKKIKNGADFTVEYKGEQVNVSKYSIVDVNDFPEIGSEYLQDLDVYALSNIVGSKLIGLAAQYVPSSIAWEYSESNLLPSRIDYESFVGDVGICVPLRNMFELAGYSKPGDSLREAESKTNGVRNILLKVSRNATAHMKKVWPEWKNLQVSITQNGEFLEAGVQDEYNFYSIDRRSDGFKRFFTFLLMVSAQNHTERISGNIIVIDEPDIGLHPSGIQYLRDELKKIGENNLVLISTHSIFMVDKDDVGRHLIVEKDKELTSIKPVDTSNVLDEEVIFKALGYSLFDLLKPRNIVFEGWRDKRVFEVFLGSRAGKKLLKDIDTKGLGCLHAIGVKDVPRVANICENFCRDYIVLTDSDKPALERKRRHDGLGEWVVYSDIENVNAVTTEDFIDNKLISKAVKSVLKQHGHSIHIQLGDEITRDKINYLKKEIGKMGLDADDLKKIMNDIKEFIVKNMKAADLNAAYADVCVAVLGRLNAVAE